MEVLFDRILQMLPSETEIICRRPTAKIIGIRKISELDTTSATDYLYIGTFTEARAITIQPQSNYLILCDKEISEEWNFQQANVALIRSKDVYLKVVEEISCVLSEFSALDNISRNMISIIHAGGDVHKLIDYVYGIINNPIMLVDISFNLIAHVGTSVLRNEDAWRYALENNMFSSKYIRYIMNRSNVSDKNHLVAGDIRVELPNEVTSVKQYSARVSQGNVVLGYLKLLEANHPVSDFELKVFQALSYYVPFTRSSTNGRIPDVISLAEDFLQSLLMGKLKDKHEIASRQKLYNLKFYKNLYLIGINFVGVQITNDIISFLLQQIRSHFRNNLVVWADGTYIVLYDSNDANLAENSYWIGQLQADMETLNCIANVSIPFQDLSLVQNYYRQVMFCSEFRAFSCEHEKKKILFYRDIFEYHMILSLGKELDLADMLHPAVKILQDTPSAADLLQTLFIYVRNQCSIPNTAKVMFLHYNTLKNRILRIKDLTGFQEQDSRECFWIMLSEQILELQGFERKKNEMQNELQ